MSRQTRRLFKRLKDIWELISQDDFYLSDIFPEEQIIPEDKMLEPASIPKPRLNHHSPIFPNRQLQETVQIMRNGVERITDEWVERQNRITRAIDERIATQRNRVVTVLTSSDHENKEEEVIIRESDYWDYGVGVT